MARGSVLRRALKTECRELRRRTALESLASEAWLVGRRLETQQKSLRHLSGCTERPAEHQETASCYPTSSDSDGDSWAPLLPGLGALKLFSTGIRAATTALSLPSTAREVGPASRQIVGAPVE